MKEGVFSEVQRLLFFNKELLGNAGIFTCFRDQFIVFQIHKNIFFNLKKPDFLCFSKL